MSVETYERTTTTTIDVEYNGTLVIILTCKFTEVLTRCNFYENIKYPQSWFESSEMVVKKYVHVVIVFSFWVL